MTSRDFCFWLQGFFELRGAEGGPQPADRDKLDPEQVATIKRHLALVFRHEIDPAMGDEDHQAELNKVHVAPEMKKEEAAAILMKAVTQQQLDALAKRVAAETNEHTLKAIEAAKKEARPSPGKGGLIMRC